jgi:hypothetical protein
MIGIGMPFLRDFKTRSGAPTATKATDKRVLPTFFAFPKKLFYGRQRF